MIKEVVLRDFPNWTPEKQLSEYQAYKKLGSFSPFSEADYSLMEMVINNPNAEVSVQCEDGVCEIVKTNKDELVKLLNEAVTEEQTKLFDLIKGALLASPQVKAFILDGEQENKRRIISYMLKNFNDDVIASLANIFSYLGGETDKKAIFAKWEKVVLLKYKNLITKLHGIRVLDIIDKTDFKINYDRIDGVTLSTVKRYPQVSAIIFLDLVNLLPDNKRTEFLKSLVSILDTIQHPTDAPVADLADDEEVDTSSAGRNMELEKTNEYLAIALEQMKINAIETSALTVKTIGGSELENQKKMNVPSFVDYFNTYAAKDDAHKITDFDLNKLKDRFIKEFKVGVEQNLSDDIITIDKFISALSTSPSIRDAVLIGGKDKKLTFPMLISLCKQFGVDYTSSDKVFDLQEKLIRGLEKFESTEGIVEFMTNGKNSKMAERQQFTDNLNSDPDFIILNKLKGIAKTVGREMSHEEIKIYFDSISELNVISPSPGQVKSVLNAVYQKMKSLGDKYATLAVDLMKYGKDAEGRGEKFVEFALPYSYSGGQNSYDIKLGPLAFEVKTYKVDGNVIAESIRLGQEGNVFKAEKFARMFIFISDLATIFNNDSKNYSLLHSLFSSSMTQTNYGLISTMLTNPASVGRSSYSLVEQLRKGEFSEGHMLLFKKLIVVLRESLLSVKKNNFYFMKIYLKNKNLDLSIEPLDDTETKLDNIEQDTILSFKAKTLFTKEDQQTMSSTILRILGNTEILNNENYLEEIVTEAMDKINDEFARHPMIILNDFLRYGVDSTEVCSGVHTQFTFAQITQNKFKIIPAGYTEKK